VQRGGGISRRAQRTLGRSTSIAAARANGLVQGARHRDVAEHHPSDEKLLDRVRSELFRSPEVPKGQVNINVEHGTVVLRGHVDSLAMRTSLETASRAVQGVNAVENLINVTS
jgi:osmotically-inducible protein OsmY